MKHIIRYDGYSTSERVDDILDKISKYGIHSLTKLEKEFLDAHANNDQEKIHSIITKEESEKVFEDDNGYFRFEFQNIEYNDESIDYIGTIFVPDFKLPCGRTLEGRIEGRISSYNGIVNSPDFFYYIDDNIYYDIFEFCDGIEQELDSFIDYIVDELKNYDI